METQAFHRIVDRRCQAIKQTLAAKAKEYARGDRLHNFKRAAAFMRTTAEAVCFGFMMKHWTSVADIVDDIGGGFTPTLSLMREKIGDAINYLVLLEAIIEERIEADVQKK